MAFNIKNLMAVANNKSTGGGIPSLWAFWNEDADTVTAAGFIPSTVGVKEGDQVEIIDQDYGNSTKYAATVSSGVITLAVYI